ncbi:MULTISPECIES: NAD(P)H-dependent oxidoreductase [Grimontia]|uniref:General stress protein 14 n=1 Tax=Grimontia marina TaxID=646534 RepID=A0A128FCP8_9GAMM|nr:MULTISPECIES: NAD(P)H-dependent oxidoreductase [Grimontia]WRV99647.1 NAD(P)H-dependent oxidoreductase [Grimontia sp. NTOU-MAR1]CZF84569.1 General stress protein 14 [Grimontia marina]
MADNKKRVLVLFAHPSQRRSEVNSPLFKVAQSVEGVTTVDLYGEYPDYHINIDLEQKRLLEHDVVIFQFPLYWYSTPSILKEWQDLVLEYGFAYGSDGIALCGKQFLCAITAGGMEGAYKADGFNQFKIRDLLSPLEQMANLTGMKYLAPFALFGSRTAIEDNKVDRHVAAYELLLKAFVDGNVDLDAAASREKITVATIGHVLKEGES